jgi:hypothetical protein
MTPSASTSRVACAVAVRTESDTVRVGTRPTARLHVSKRIARGDIVSGRYLNTRGPDKSKLGAHRENCFLLTPGGEETT